MSTAAGTTRNNGHTNGLSLNQKLAYAFGAIYILVGILGFFASEGEPFIGRNGGELLGLFGVNGLHNIVHILIGLALVGAARSGHAAARSANAGIGIFYLVLGVLGFLIQNTAINLFALDVQDHILHLLSGAVLFAVSRRESADAHTRTA